MKLFNSIILTAFIFLVCPIPVSAIETSATSINFGTFHIGQSLPVRNLTIINNHPENDLTILDFQFTGPDSSCFKVISTSGTTQMAPTESLTVVLQFTPSRLGTHNADYIIVSDDAASSAITISLTGIQEDYPDNQWVFYFSEESIVIDCPQAGDYCQAETWFEVSPPLNSNCGDSSTPLDFAKAVADNMQLSFSPCSQIIAPDLIGNPSYGIIYETRNGACETESNAKCVLQAAIVPASVTLTGNDCHVKGKLKISVSGTDNVKNCTNYSYEDTDENGDPVTINTGFHFFLTSGVTAFFPHTGETSYEDNLEIIVTGTQDQDVEDYTDLEYYRASIRVTDLEGTLVDFELRFRDATGSYVALPSAVSVTKIDWTVDDILTWSASAPDGFMWTDYDFPGTEHKIRALVHISFNSSSGTVNVVLKSNELRLYVPNPGTCADGTVPKVRNVPPVLKPDTAPARAIFSNVTVDNIPDYGNYTGTGDLFNISPGYWHGGAAKGGVWGSWVNDNNAGRAGTRKFTFKNALPWEVYELCPVVDVELPEVLNSETVDLDGDGPGYYNACADTKNLICPIETDGMIAWNLAWTTYGWLCLRHVCIFQEDNTINVDQGEFWNCDE
ncbi:immunoglobulin-like fold-containing [Desulfonema limicola]|uniref:Immunoglobulin-like fold-containing n=1 Tax=Desulfonema limicola TaxID=45656 RepID=A0A975GEQ4_9BACT|nr:choice-of-anchor D domain-containing protein [Desulfonema limicola]QTA78476.1 immunoglobulin-like fold-containing [Desulfonema limicola]